MRDKVQVPDPAHSSLCGTGAQKAETQSWNISLGLPERPIVSHSWLVYPQKNYSFLRHGGPGSKAKPCELTSCTGSDLWGKKSQG